MNKLLNIITIAIIGLALSACSAKELHNFNDQLLPKQTITLISNGETSNFTTGITTYADLSNELNDCSFLGSIQYCTSESFKNNVISKIRNDTKSLINESETIKRPNWINQQDLSFHIKENKRLTDIYNQLIQAVYNDWKHYKNVSKEVSRYYSKEIPIQTIYIKSDNELLIKINGNNNIINDNYFVNLFTSKLESEYLSEQSLNNIVFNHRKAFVTQAENEHPPYNKYGDVYINKHTVDKYNNDEDVLYIILLHEAFHVFFIPEIEKSQIINQGLSSLIYSMPGINRNKRIGDIDELKKHMDNRFFNDSQKSDEFKIDRLVMLHLRKNKIMREKYINYLASNENSPRVIAAKFLDKYIDDEQNIDILEQNLIDIEIGFVSYGTNVNDLGRMLMTPEFNLLRNKALNSTTKEEQKTELQKLNETVKQKVISQYKLNKLRPHAVNGDIDNYKEYISIVFNKK